jgi:hypothetical protein
MDVLRLIVKNGCNRSEIYSFVIFINCLDLTDVVDNFAHINSLFYPKIAASQGKIDRITCNLLVLLLLEREFLTIDKDVNTIILLKM